MVKKQYITATVSLLASVAIMITASVNFVAAREVPLPMEGPGVTEVKMLSDWFDGLEGTNGDTPVYVLKGAEEGGSMLILGGTHANEPSGYLSAFTFIETAVVDKGTVYVIPYTNYSAMTHNDPGEGTLQYFTITTQSGERTFRFGSRATNPVDQWPDPDVYVHYPSGQRLSGSETRNINRAYPGRPDGNLTEKMAYGVTQLIEQENIALTFDLHEASPEYTTINATVAHENSMEIASLGCMELLMQGIDMSLEVSPTNLHGASTVEQILGGKDSYYVLSEQLGMLFVPYDESGHPIEERCGRHLEGIYQYSQEYNSLYPDAPIEYSGVPGYDALFLSADPEMLGGSWLGTFLL